MPTSYLTCRACLAGKHTRCEDDGACACHCQTSDDPPEDEPPTEPPTEPGVEPTQP